MERNILGHSIGPALAQHTSLSRLQTPTSPAARHTIHNPMRHLMHDDIVLHDTVASWFRRIPNIHLANSGLPAVHSHTKSALNESRCTPAPGQKRNETYSGGCRKISIVKPLAILGLSPPLPPRSKLVCWKLNIRGSGLDVFLGRRV